MKTFPGYDHLLCCNERCNKKNTCMLYLTWIKCVKEEWPFPVELHIPGKGECEKYIEAK